MSDDTARGGPRDPAVRAAVEQALTLVGEGMGLGLGSGRAASLFIELLGARCRDGLSVHAVASSRESAELAHASGVPLRELDAVTELDLTIDGADEVAANLDLIKGWGGALARERIVAAASKRQVIVVGVEKLVPALGTRGRLPVEVLPFGRALAARRIRALGMVPTVRTAAGRDAPFLTENGNLILDCAPAGPLPDGRAAREAERALLAIPGVVDTGLFLGTADQVLVGHPDGRVDVLRRAGG